MRLAELIYRVANGFATRAEKYEYEKKLAERAFSGSNPVHVARIV